MTKGHKAALYALLSLFYINHHKLINERCLNNEEHKEIPALSAISLVVCIAMLVGSTFAKQGADGLEKVVLTDVVSETEATTAWSPVTVGHLCCFTNDMLSMPGGVGGLFNIFEVDAETMTYDCEALASDIETYGLFTYEEVNAIAPLTEEMFYAAGGQYLKISIGKGNMTEAELAAMITRYSKYI